MSREGAPTGRTFDTWLPLVALASPEVEATIRAPAANDALEHQWVAADHLGDFQLGECAGALVGCAALERYGRDGLLSSVAVRPEERGAGLEQALVRRVLARAAADGVQRVALLTTTAHGARLLPARRLPRHPARRGPNAGPTVGRVPRGLPGLRGRDGARSWALDVFGDGSHKNH